MAKAPAFVMLVTLMLAALLPAASLLTLVA